MLSRTHLEFLDLPNFSRCTAISSSNTPFVTVQVARHDSSGATSVICWSCHIQDHIRTTGLCRPTYCRRQEQDKCYITKGSASRWHTYCFHIEEITDSFERKFLPGAPGHCIHHVLTPKTSACCPYSLRKRQHYYQLPNIEFSQYKNCFINWCLFKFRWSFFICFVLFTADKGGGTCFCLCLFVCLSVSKITQKRVHGFGWNVACRQTSGHGRTH